MGEPILQVIFIYSLFFWIVTIPFLFVKKRFKRRIILIVYISILLSPSLFYIPIEINTYLHGYEFKDIQIDNEWNLPTIYYKIFSINDNEAKIFYVEGENGKHQIGKMYTFIKKDGKWTYCNWSPIWTNLGGSASETTFPPYF